MKGLTLDMFSGKLFCLLGHNGAGKTTTMGMLTGLQAPSFTRKKHLHTLKVSTSGG